MTSFLPQDRYNKLVEDLYHIRDKALQEAFHKHLGRYLTLEDGQLTHVVVEKTAEGEVKKYFYNGELVHSEWKSFTVKIKP